MDFTLPAGFSFWYVVIFAGGMLLHYIKKIIEISDKSTFFKLLTANFYGWFVNQGVKTALTGAAGAILLLASNFGLSIVFTTINALAVVLSVMAGYIADSAINRGEIKP